MEYHQYAIAVTGKYPGAKFKVKCQALIKMLCCQGNIAVLGSKVEKILIRMGIAGENDGN